MSKLNSGETMFPEDEVVIKKGKYEVFEVGDELVYSEDREKIKDYAKKKNVESIEYKMTLDNVEDLGDSIKEI